ncbi:hypothetical protein [Edwardsiella tarda]|uniref:hypothetical protein n=1 Tax=Edwardsiella tarda TaxID=636 RepID=UPI00351C1436
MVTGRSNNKSLQVSVRLPHDVLELIEQVKMTGKVQQAFLLNQPAVRSNVASGANRKLTRQQNDPRWRITKEWPYGCSFY